MRYWTKRSSNRDAMRPMRASESKECEHMHSADEAVGLCDTGLSEARIVTRCAK